MSSSYPMNQLKALCSRAHATTNATPTTTTTTTKKHLTKEMAHIHSICRWQFVSNSGNSLWFLLIVFCVKDPLQSKCLTLTDVWLRLSTEKSNIFHPEVIAPVIKKQKWIQRIRKFCQNSPKKNLCMSALWHMTTITTTT